jgi:hypothetical protein
MLSRYYAPGRHENISTVIVTYRFITFRRDPTDHMGSPFGETQVSRIGSYNEESL